MPPEESVHVAALEGLQDAFQEFSVEMFPELELVGGESCFLGVDEIEENLDFLYGAVTDEGDGLNGLLDVGGCETLPGDLLEGGLDWQELFFPSGFETYTPEGVNVESLFDVDFDYLLSPEGGEANGPSPGLDLLQIEEVEVVAPETPTVADLGKLMPPPPPPEAPANLLSMFPHMKDENNRRRRSLLYENTFTPSSKENKQKGGGEPRPPRHYKKPDPLLNHDYTQRKGDDKYFPCPEENCEKIYAKTSHLKAHLRRHSGEKPFACNWQHCTWRFSRSDELARHKRSHSGDKPYKCDMCEKAFARSDHLSKHRKVHNKRLAQFGSSFIKRRSRFSAM